MSMQEESAPGEAGDDTASAREPSEPAARPAIEATGEPRVDAALRRLGELDDAAVSEHPPVFERIHGQLVEVLGELHTGTG
jgi:hypothetical protein